MHRTKKVEGLFERQVAIHPNHIAVRYNKEQITYFELNRKTNQLALYLIERHQGMRSNYVPILLDKSIESLISILAVLKAGFSYIPLHPEASAQMISNVLTHCEASIVLTKKESLERFSSFDGVLIFLDELHLILDQYSGENLERSATTSDVAYAIYTSGTTGLPKGVLVTHNNLIQTFTSWANTFELNPYDVHLQMANPAFDVFVGDYLRALCSGATLVLCPQELLVNPQALYELILERGITCAEFIPAVLRSFLDYLEKNKLTLAQFRLLLCGSDVWTMEEYRKTRSLLGTSARVINTYGLTEATIDSTYFEEANSSLSDLDIVPIGKPFDHVRVHVLDEQLNPLVNEVGELYIGGQGVALGYLKQEELTAERFITHPITAERLYKTGDYAKKTLVGTVEFLGRNQTHVKINGNRVELLAVERVLKLHPKIEFAVAYCEMQPTPKLGCLLLLCESSLSFEELNSFLKEQLPSYCIPQYMFIIEEIVVNQNGKIERTLASQKIIKELKPSRIVPQSRLEEKLCTLWRSHLGVDELGVLCSFEELGGNSLTWASFLDTFNRAYNLSLTCSVPRTIRALAQHIEREGK